MRIGRTYEVSVLTQKLPVRNVGCFPVNNDSSERACGWWAYRMVRNPSDVPGSLADVQQEFYLDKAAKKGVNQKRLYAV